MTNKPLTWTQVKPLLQKGYWATYDVWAPGCNYRCRIQNNEVQLTADHMKGWEPFCPSCSEREVPGWHIVIPTDGTIVKGLTWDEIKPALEDGMFARFLPWCPGCALRLRNGVQEVKDKRGVWNTFMRYLNGQDYDFSPSWSIIPDPDAQEQPQNTLKEENERLKKEIETLKIYLKNANETNNILDNALINSQNTVRTIKAFVENA